MADSSLVSILAGTDSLSPEILQALHNEQARNIVADPANWQNQGIAGGLARALAGFLAPSNTDVVKGITSQRQAAQPDLAKLLASTNPFGDIAANPDQYSPIARAQILAGATPLNAAQTKEAAANAALAGLNVSGFTGLQGGIGQPATAGGIGAPANKKIAPSGPLTMTSGPGIGGRYPAPAAGAADTPAVDPVAAGTALSPQQRQAMLQNPQMRAQLLARLRALAGQRGQPATAGGAVALRPPT